MKNKCIICVDGGGTKTEAVAFTPSGEAISRHIGGSGNFSFEKEQAIENVINTIQAVFNEVKELYHCEMIQMGISGYGAFQEKSAYIEQVKLRFNTDVKIVDDARLALYTVLKETYNEGILVLSGTGSACYGYCDGNTLLVGGWGYLLGDEGSSYDLVMRTFKLMIEDEENGLALNGLTINMLKHLDLNHVTELKKYVYKKTKSEIASNAKFINDCALLGDERAITLLKQSGIDLARQAIKIYERMKLSSHVRIGCQGSFILNAKYVNVSFKEVIKKVIPHACFVETLDRPVKGAYYLAIREHLKIDGGR
ncbi:ATPase [Mycoplasmatota bacterium]|nr:ATPase [Mycoplasmatota bacterium]